MSRSAAVLRAGAPDLERALTMRFVREAGAGTLTDQTWANYLALESDFVLTAARLHGYALWDTPSWTAARHHGLAVHALVTEQADYFRAARGRAPTPARLSDDARARARQLTDHALDAAREGGHAAATTVLFAAETLYLTWCTRALRTATPAPGPVREWIRLHTTDDFRSGVGALAEQVDQIPARVSDRTLADWFIGMVRAEVTFHDATFPP